MDVPFAPSSTLAGGYVGRRERGRDRRESTTASLSLFLYLRRIPDIDLKFGVTRLLHIFSQRLD